MQGPLPDNTRHSQQADIHAPARFEPTIPASERPQTHTLDRAITGNGGLVVYERQKRRQKAPMLQFFIHFLQTMHNKLDHGVTTTK